MYPGRVVIYGQAGKKYTVGFGFLFINFVLSVVKYFYCGLSGLPISLK